MLLYRIGLRVPLGLLLALLAALFAITVVAPDREGPDLRTFLFVSLHILVFLSPVLLMWAVIGALVGVGADAVAHRPNPTTNSDHQAEPRDAADSR